MRRLLCTAAVTTTAARYKLERLGPSPATVVAALAALAPRLVRLAHHVCPTHARHPIVPHEGEARLRREGRCPSARRCYRMVPCNLAAQPCSSSPPSPAAPRRSNPPPRPSSKGRHSTPGLGSRRSPSHSPVRLPRGICWSGGLPSTTPPGRSGCPTT